MHEVPVDHPALPWLFDRRVPNSPVLWSVLEGRNQGRALVDNYETPSQCLLRTDAVLTFFSSQVSETFLSEAIARFRGAGPIWLVWPPGKSIDPTIFEDVYIDRRLEFFELSAHSRSLLNWRRRLPLGSQVRTIDKELLEHCEWRAAMEFYCGSLENFLENGIGICLQQGDKILCEAYASSLGGGKAEIGAVTRKACRGRGYAPITCAYLIEACATRGFQPIWSCDEENQPSIRVARKLGFRKERPYKILEFSSL